MTFYTEVEVEIDDYELAAAGYHHEDACPPQDVSDHVRRLERALLVMHLAYHTEESVNVGRCLKEPCRSLELEL